MKRKFFSIIAATSFLFGAGSNAHAEQNFVTERDYIWELSNQNELPIIKQNNLLAELLYPNGVSQVAPIHFIDAGVGVALWTIAQTQDNGILSNDVIKWDNLSSDLVKSVTFTNSMITNVIGTNPLENDTKIISQPEQDQADSATMKPENPESIESAEPKEPMESVESAESVETVEPDESTELIVPEEPSESENKEPEPNETKGKEITVEATAYTADCEGCSGITKTGVNLTENPEEKVIAVDPSVIPLGSKVHVEGYGNATAADIGGGIDGHEIDVFIPEKDDALEWGRKEVKVTIID